MLKNLRKNRNLTQEQLGVLSGMHKVQPKNEHLAH